MSVNPSCRALLATVVCAATAAAQLRPGMALPEPAFAQWLQGEPVAVTGASAPACTVFAVYSRSVDAHRLAHEARYLAGLQQRFAARGLASVAVVGDAAAGVPAAWAGQRVALDPDGRLGEAWLALEEWHVVAVARGGQVVFTGTPESGLVDAIERTLAGAPAIEREREVAELRLTLPARFDDATAAIVPVLAQALAHAPHDGVLAGLEYLALATKANDGARADAAVERALATLAAEPRPLAAFADLALRGDRQRAGLAAALRPALQAAVTATPDDVVANLALLRALVQLGDGRELGRRSMRAKKLVLGDATSCLDFVAVLTLDANAAAHRDLATIALDRAAELDAAPRLLAAARYAVAVRCEGDADAGKRLRDRYLEDLPDRTMINNDCWYFMTELATMGRFDVFAAGLAERMLEERERMDYFEFDTAALAMFLVGRVGEAVELQQQALAKGGKDNPEYQERLRRYEAARAPAPR